VKSKEIDIKLISSPFDEMSFADSRRLTRNLEFQIEGLRLLHRGKWTSWIDVQERVEGT